MSRPISSESVFRAIAHPIRREILDNLRQGERSVGELLPSNGVTRAMMSQHLRVLRAAGLLASRRKGTYLMCRLNRSALAPLVQWADRFRNK